MSSRRRSRLGIVGATWPAAPPGGTGATYGSYQAHRRRTGPRPIGPHLRAHRAGRQHPEWERQPSEDPEGRYACRRSLAITSGPSASPPTRRIRCRLALLGTQVRSESWCIRATRRPHLSSIGCFNPTNPPADQDMIFAESRARDRHDRQPARPRSGRLRPGQDGQNAAIAMRSWSSTASR